MFISSLSPESLVEDPSYVAMIAAANPRLTTLFRSTLSRATSCRFQELHDEARAGLDCVSVCHVKTDMWTSLANEPFGSFVISWLDDDWELRTRVLRCAVLNRRHTAAAIATFLLKVAAQINLGSKVRVVRTDGASNCVLAGSVLGTAMREDGPRGCMVDGGRGGTSVADAGSACDAVDAGRLGDAGGVAVIGARLTGGQVGAGEWSEESDDEEGGDGADLDDVGSDYGEPAHSPDALSGESLDATAEAEVRADAFFTAIPDALRPGGATPTHTGDASFLWQHGRCATHTLQLSVRAGLVTPTLGSILTKVRLVAKLCRNSTNLSEALRVSVGREEALLAAAAEREPVTATKLVSRLIIDCPTRWGSTLAMVRRFVRVGAAIPPALSAFYHHAAVSSSKTRVECLNSMEQAALLSIIDFLTVLESASASLGSETEATSGMEETVFWYMREIGAPVVGEREEVATLKRVALSDMHVRREKERLRGPYPDWFCIRLAAVLCDPFTKTFAFGNKPGTAALAQASALAVIKWMVERAARRKTRRRRPHRMVPTSRQPIIRARF